MHGAADPSRAHRTHDAHTNATWLVPHIHPQRMREGRQVSHTLRRWAKAVSDVGGMKACMVRPVRAGRTAHTVLTQTLSGSSLTSTHSASDSACQHGAGPRR